MLRMSFLDSSNVLITFVYFSGNASIRIVAPCAAACSAILERFSFRYSIAFSGEIPVACLCFGDPNTRTPPPNLPTISTSFFRWSHDLSRRTESAEVIRKFCGPKKMA